MNETQVEMDNQKWAKVWDQNPELWDEFTSKSCYLAYKKAESQGRVRIYKRPVNADTETRAT